MCSEYDAQNYDRGSSVILKCLPMYLQANHVWYESSIELLTLKNGPAYAIILLNIRLTWKFYSPAMLANSLHYTLTVRNTICSS